MSNKTKVPVTAAARLKNDYLRLKKEPIPLVYAEVRTFMVFIRVVNPTEKCQC